MFKRCSFSAVKSFLWFWSLSYRTEGKQFLMNLHQNDNLLLYFDKFLICFTYSLHVTTFYFCQNTYCRKLSGSTISAHTDSREIQKKTAFGSGIPLLFRSLQFQEDFTLFELFSLYRNWIADKIRPIFQTQKKTSVFLLNLMSYCDIPELFSFSIYFKKVLCTHHF